MAFTSVPSVVITDNIPDDGVLLNCAGTSGDYTFTASDVTGAVVGQTVIEQGIGDNAEFGIGAKITNITGTGPYTVTVDVANRKTFTGVLAVSVSDRGVITKVKIADKGHGYFSIPTVNIPVPDENLDDVPSNDRRKAKIVATSTTIGKIKEIDIVAQGFNQEEIPLLIPPICGITYDVTKSFKRGELVYDANYDYGVIPLTEEAIEAGPHARVKYFDAARNYIVLEDTTDSFELTNEDGLVLTIENGYTLTNEYNQYFGYGTLVKGFATGAETKFLWLNRAAMIAENGSFLKREAVFNDANGFTSESIIKLHDGVRIQDFSYFVRTIPQIIEGISTSIGFNEYKDVLKRLVHPAGYSMFGETQIEAYASAMARLYRRLDASGGDIGYGSLITIVLELINTYSDINYNQIAVGDPRADKYKQIMLLFEKYLLVTKDNDMDDLGKQMHQIMLEQYVNLGGIAEMPFMFHLYYTQYVDTFVGLRPSSLDRVKFNYDEPASIFDKATFTDFENNIFGDKSLRKLVLLQDITII